MRLTRTSMVWAAAVVAAMSLGFVVAQQQAAAPSPITVVELKAMGFWPASNWRITYHSDLSAERWGKIEPRAGTIKGTLEPESWAHLVTFVEGSGFDQLKSAYSPDSEVSDAQHLVVSVTRGATTASVDCYAGAGPTEFWALQMVLRGMADAVTWKRTYGGNDK